MASGGSECHGAVTLRCQELRELRPLPRGSGIVNHADPIIVLVQLGLGLTGGWDMLVLKGRNAVASRAVVPKIRLAGLERAARHAGEAFAYEELSGHPDAREVEAAQLRRLWWVAAAIALVGLVMLALR